MSQYIQRTMPSWLNVPMNAWDGAAVASFHIFFMFTSQAYCSLLVGPER